MEAEPASGQSVQRYYDPMIPQFLSVDPVTAYSDPVAMFNRYRYAVSNPYRFSDPDGRWPAGYAHILGGAPSRARLGPTDNGDSDLKIRAEALARKNAAEGMIERMGPAIEGIVADSPEEAAEIFVAIFLPASVYLDLEFGANIVPADNSVVGWSIRNIATSDRFELSTGIGFDVRIRSIRGGYDVHTHSVIRRTSDWFNPFSPSDASLVSMFELRSFLGLPDGSIYILRPGAYPEKIR